MKKASVNTNTNTNSNIFSELLERASKVKKQARERGGESVDNLKQGYATLVKQASKNSKDGFRYVMHNANILTKEVIKMLECNAGERASVDKNKVLKFVYLMSDYELDACKIAISESLEQEREQAQEQAKKANK